MSSAVACSISGPMTSFEPRMPGVTVWIGTYTKAEGTVQLQHKGQSRSHPPIFPPPASWALRSSLLSFLEEIASVFYLYFRLCSMAACSSAYPGRCAVAMGGLLGPLLPRGEKGVLLEAPVLLQHVGEGGGRGAHLHDDKSSIQRTQIPHIRAPAAWRWYLLPFRAFTIWNLVIEIGSVE